jgi:WD40 repeat protein
VDTQSQLNRLEGHESGVLEAAFSADSTHIASASIDHTLKVWDIARSACVGSLTAEGFVQCVAWGGDIAYAGDTRCNIVSIDRRFSTQRTDVIKNDSMVNSLYVYRSGSHILTGDHRGYLKTWDLRNTKQPIDITANGNSELSHQEQQSRDSDPVSHIAVARMGKDEGRYMSVNCFDNGMLLFLLIITYTKCCEYIIVGH